ncbi:type II toxin-antitoxin system RatA family toxin [Azohydromonas sediminis]|uniref:type II toxin-antitoxin system RatA family toxin n=1 Tax=Azohydromonas sediminis TaxID=2259674 RepID=UPI000E659A81|nr:type II toxin-antitoxin system RatA family toxin [Azohydromonas sediminis]
MTRQVHKSALVLRPAPMMFDLIEAAEDYPRFLPWCAGATILARDDSLVAADLDIVYRGFRWRVGTRNPKRRPEHMAIHLVRGPFRHFEGQWRLTPLADDACKVEFDLTYEFDHSIATQLAGPVFARIADTVVDAFVKRAHSLPAPPTTVLPAAAPTSPAAVADAGVSPAPPAPTDVAPVSTKAPPPVPGAPPPGCDAA